MKLFFLISKKVAVLLKAQDTLTLLKLEPFKDPSRTLEKVFVAVKIGIWMILGLKMVNNNQLKIVELNVNLHLVAMLLMFQITMQGPKNTNVGCMVTKIQSLLLA